MVKLERKCYYCNKIVECITVEDNTKEVFVFCPFCKQHIGIVYKDTKGNIIVSEDYNDRHKY